MELDIKYKKLECFYQDNKMKNTSSIKTEYKYFVSQEIKRNEHQESSQTIFINKTWACSSGLNSSSLVY